MGIGKQGTGSEPRQSRRAGRSVRGEVEREVIVSASPLLLALEEHLALIKQRDWPEIRWLDECEQAVTEIRHQLGSVDPV